jgi:hypothetical protein
MALSCRAKRAHRRVAPRAGGGVVKINPGTGRGGGGGATLKRSTSYPSPRLTGIDIRRGKIPTPPALPPQNKVLTLGRGRQ